MSDPNSWRHDDEALLRELREAVAGGADVPADVLSAAKAAFALKSLDADLELLSLTYDSTAAPQVQVRGGDRDPTRMLVFDGQATTVEVEVGIDTLLGQIVPARPERVSVESADGVLGETEADDAGFFLLRRWSAPAGSGPVRFTVHCEPRVVTEWVLL